MKLVEAPQEADPVVGQVGGPVAEVHGHEDESDGAPAGHRPDTRQDDPREGAAGDLREGEAQGGDQRDDQRDVEYGEEQILAVATGDERPPLGRAHPLRHEEDPDDDQGGRTDDDEPEGRHGGPEAGPSPVLGPPDGHQGGGDGDDGECGQIDP
jgi:hypothetical protein